MFEDELLFSSYRVEKMDDRCNLLGQFRRFGRTIELVCDTLCEVGRTHSPIAVWIVHNKIIYTHTPDLVLLSGGEYSPHAFLYGTECERAELITKGVIETSHRPE